MTRFMTRKMVVININEAKTHLSKYTRMVKKGQRVILCERNQPFAEIRPLMLTKEGRRPYGLGKGMIQVPHDFNEPDAEIDAMFHGPRS
jgi:antitoxin (DNA-binding transcriptional repressor) of toxin-antitoxin stability system